MKRCFIIVFCLTFIAISSFSAEQQHVTIQYAGNNTHSGNAQIELVNQDGERVIIGLYDPSLLTSPASEKDVLLMACHDYYLPDFIRDFPGERLLVRVGEIKRPGLYVRGIASDREEREMFLEVDGTNYIFLVEMAGLRIADLGYIGQKRLTSEQLAILGQVDIVLAPLYNFRNGMNAYNRKGFNLIDQIQPKLIIPTGLDPDSAEDAIEQWPGSYWDEPFTIERSKLPRETRVLFMGPTARQYGKRLKIPKATP